MNCSLPAALYHSIPTCEPMQRFCKTIDQPRSIQPVLRVAAASCCLSDNSAPQSALCHLSNAKPISKCVHSRWACRPKSDATDLTLVLPHRTSEELYNAEHYLVRYSNRRAYRNGDLI